MGKDSEKGKYTNPDGVATWEYVSTACCALLVFCVGCMPAWVTPTLGILMGPESPVPTTADEGSTLAAAVPIGCMIAPIITILIVDRIGRKSSLAVGAIPLIIGWGITVIAKDVTVLIVSRLLGGISMGLTLSIVPMYLGEIASVRIRGLLGMTCSTMVNAGTVFMFMVVPHLSIRTMAGISLGIITIATLLVWFIPESPYSLAMRGRYEEAEISLEKLRGKTDVTEELNLIRATLQYQDKVVESGEKKKESTTSALQLLFAVPANRKSLLINALFSTALSCGGFMVISTYCTIIFQAMQAPISPNTSMIFTGSLQFITNVLTSFVVERFGRRSLVRISGIISGASLLVVAVYFYLLENTNIDVTPYSLIALCATFINLIAVCIGLSPLQMVIQSETIASEVKAPTSSILAVTGGLLISLNLKIYIHVAITLGYGHSVPLFGYAITTWLCTIFILKLLPETRGKTFLEIQNSLKK